MSALQRLRAFAAGGPYTWRAKGWDTDFNALRADVSAVVALAHHDSTLAASVPGRLLLDDVYAEARQRFMQDATQPLDMSEHLVRVAAEQALALYRAGAIDGR